MKEKIYYFIVLALLLTCNCFAQLSGHKYTYYYVMTEYYQNGAPTPFQDQSRYYSFSNVWCYRSNSDGRPFEDAYRYRGNKDGYKWYSMGVELAGWGWKWYSEWNLFVTSDNSEIREVIDLSSSGDNSVFVKVWKRSDPSNNRSSGSNNSPTYTPRTYTPPPSSNNQKRRVERTCTWCNGKGLVLSNVRCPLEVFHDCVDIYCSSCGKTHCRSNTRHENCPMCDGTGKKVTYEY